MPLRTQAIKATGNLRGCRRPEIISFSTFSCAIKDAKDVKDLKGLQTRTAFGNPSVLLTIFHLRAGLTA